MKGQFKNAGIEFSYHTDLSAKFNKKQEQVVLGSPESPQIFVSIFEKGDSLNEIEESICEVFLQDDDFTLSRTRPSRMLNNLTKITGKLIRSNRSDGNFVCVEVFVVSLKSAPVGIYMVYISGGLQEKLANQYLDGILASLK